MEANGHLGGDAIEPRVKEPRTRKKPGAKPPTEVVSKRSLNLRVDDETYERLTIHAMKRRGTISDLVMELTRTHLREYSVRRNGQSGSSEG